MVYMGSKRRYAKDIVPIIQKFIEDNDIEIFIDLFCGGANLIDKIQCKTLIANDLSPSLIALHKQAIKDFSEIPVDGCREYWDKAYTEWKKMKKMCDNNLIYQESEDMPLYLIGAIEWYASFANGGFPRGYAKNSPTRNYYQEAYRNHEKQAQNDNYKKIHFFTGDYQETLKSLEELYDIDKKKVLIYCDSPYKGTKPYAIDSKFDFDRYYNWCRETSKKYPMFISEQSMPEDFNIIWEKDTVRTTNKENNFKACEKLYLLDRRDK